MKAKKYALFDTTLIIDVDSTISKSDISIYEIASFVHMLVIEDVEICLIFTYQDSVEIAYANALNYVIIWDFEHSCCISPSNSLGSREIYTRFIELYVSKDTRGKYSICLKYF